MRQITKDKLIMPSTFFHWCLCGNYTVNLASFRKIW
jgi:hypothetical protein